MKKFILLFAIVIMMTSCSIPSDPGLPTWDTVLEFYVLNDSYNMTELAEEDSAIVVIESNGDSLLYIQEEEYEEHEIELEETSPIDRTEEAEIGDIEIPDAGTVTGQITMFEFATNAGMVVPPDGTSGVIDAFSFENVDIPLEPVETFSSVLIDQGSLSLHIRNRLGITLGNTNIGQPLIMHLIHDGTQILEHEFQDNIISSEQGVYDTDEIDLSGLTLYSDMAVRISGGSRGSENQTIPFIYDNLLEIDVEFSNDMTASSVNAKIDEQSISDSVNLELDGENRYKLEFAEIVSSDSYINIHIENHIDLDMDLTVAIPALFLAGESSHYNESITIPRSSGGTSETDIAINLASAVLEQINNDPLEIIQIYADAYIDSTDDFRIIENTDFFSVEASMDPLEFEYVSGIIKQQEIEDFEDSIELDIEYPFVEEEGTLNFSGNSQIVFDIDMQETRLPLELELNIEGVDADANSVTLVNQNNQIPVIAIPDTNHFQLVFSNENYNLNELISILPEEINFNVGVTVGDSTSSISYHRGDVMEVSILFQTNLSIESDTWIIPMKDGEISIYDEEIDLEQSQYDAFKSAEIELHYRNTTGLEARGDIFIAASQENIQQNITDFETTEFDWLDIINIPFIETTADTTEKVATISVNKEDINYFLNDITYISSRLKLQSDGEQPIAGEVSLTAKLKVNIEISEDLLEEED